MATYHLNLNTIGVFFSPNILFWKNWLYLQWAFVIRIEESLQIFQGTSEKISCAVENLVEEMAVLFVYGRETTKNLSINALSIFCLLAWILFDLVKDSIFNFQGSNTSTSCLGDSWLKPPYLIRLNVLVQYS